MSLKKIVIVVEDDSEVLETIKEYKDATGFIRDVSEALGEGTLALEFIELYQLGKPVTIN